MSERIMGPEDDFLARYIAMSYRKARDLIRQAAKAGVSLEELNRMEPEYVEFQLNLREIAKNEPA